MVIPTLSAIRAACANGITRYDQSIYYFCGNTFPEPAEMQQKLDF